MGGDKIKAGDWEGVCEGLGALFQPIVNIHTGRCFGCEVLMDGYRTLGFPTPASLLDAAHAAGWLEEAEFAVRRAAQAALPGGAATGDLALFFNLDSRLLARAREIQKATRKLFGEDARLITEIRDRPREDAGEWPRLLRKHHCLTALDRFGKGVQALRLLHEGDFDFLKIDPFYTRDIDGDARKRVVVSSIVAMAHTLGMMVVALGVENERELVVCRDLGCDLVQGFHIQPPTAARAIAATYRQVEAIGAANRRRRLDPAGSWNSWTSSSPWTSTPPWRRCSTAWAAKWAAPSSRWWTSTASPWESCTSAR
ncbi:MAG: EAL domain-containing protein [Magnetospirillum sp.]|nr:EAL domain-containing protein [Magnetospirillum sp.]